MASTRGEVFRLIEESGGAVCRFSAPLLDGSAASLAEFEGRVLLIVNTAGSPPGGVACGGIAFSTTAGGSRSAALSKLSRY